MSSTEKVRAFMARKPWYVSVMAAKQRCRDPRHKSFRWYGGRGILFQLTPDQARILWERDGAAKMEHPTIDRENPDGPYTAANCRFVERTINISRRRKSGVTPRKVSRRNFSTAVDNLGTS